MPFRDPAITVDSHFGQTDIGPSHSAIFSDFDHGLILTQHVRALQAVWHATFTRYNVFRRDNEHFWSNALPASESCPQMSVVVPEHMSNTQYQGHGRPLLISGCHPPDPIRPVSLPDTWSSRLSENIKGGRPLSGSHRGVTGMFVGQGPAQDPESTRMVLLLIAASAVIFWRTLIKVVIVVAILLAALGALTLSQCVH